jgi:hypothetical protein
MDLSFMKNVASPCTFLVFAALTLMTHISAQADTFGTSGNEFTVDFVNIGNAGNAADTTTSMGRCLTNTARA